MATYMSPQIKITCQDSNQIKSNQILFKVDIYIVIINKLQLAGCYLTDYTQEIL